MSHVLDNIQSLQEKIKHRFTIDTAVPVLCNFDEMVEFDLTVSVPLYRGTRTQIEIPVFELSIIFTKTT